MEAPHTERYVRCCGRSATQLTGSLLPEKMGQLRGLIMESDIGIISCMHFIGKTIGRLLKWKKWVEDNYCLSA